MKTLSFYMKSSLTLCLLCLCLTFATIETANGHEGTTALAVYVDSKLPTAELQENATAIRPALIRPKIDGLYTPVDSLQLTPLGMRYVNQDRSWMPKDEWDDADERRLNIFYLINVSRDYPEAYFRSKFYEDRFYVLVDIVSDKFVNKGDGMHFVFDTKNVGKSDPLTPGVYCPWLKYKSDSPDSLAIYDFGETHPGSPFPENMITFKSTLGPSPHSPENHKLIEAEFDLNLLTKYSRSIGFDCSISTVVNKKDSGYYGAYILKYKRTHPFERICFSDETVPVPEFPSPLIALATSLVAAYGATKLLGRKRNDMSCR